MVNALEQFREYLIGICFVIRTDCNSFQLLADKRDPSSSIGRLFMKLSEYHYKIKYLNGDHNLVAETLSRDLVESEQQVESASLNVFSIGLTTDWVAVLQKNSE